MTKFDVSIKGQTFEVDAPNEQALPEIVETISQQAAPAPRQEPLLSIGERAKFAFGDVPGRTEFLQEKFPGQEVTQEEGVFQVGGQPIEPRGFQVKDIPGDIADVLDEIIRLTGQIPGASIGAGIGAFGGPPGAITGRIAGGAIGRGAGQAVVEGIGRTLDIREQDIPDILKDIRDEALLGAAGETVGVAIGAVSKATSNLIRKIADRFVKKVSAPIEQTIFNFTADVPKDSIARVQQRGAEILSRRNMSNENLLKINRDILNKMNDIRQPAGKAVNIAKGKLKGRKDIVVGVKDILRDLNRELKNAGVVDDTFRPIQDFGTDTAEKRLLNLRGELLRDAGKGFNTQKAFRTLDNINDIVKFGQEGKLTVGTNENRILNSVATSIRKRLAKFSPELKQANKAFAEIATIQKNLGTKIDFKAGGISTLDKLDATSKTFVKEQLQRLDDLLPESQKFMSGLLDSLAARDFASSTLKAIRTNLLPSLAGGLLGGVPGVVAGAAVSTPKVVGALIGGRQAVSKGIEAVVSGAGRGAEKIVAPAVSALSSRIGRQ